MWLEQVDKGECGRRSGRTETGTGRGQGSPAQATVRGLLFWGRGGSSSPQWEEPPAKGGGGEMGPAHTGCPVGNKGKARGPFAGRDIRQYDSNTCSEPRLSMQRHLKMEATAPADLSQEDRQEEQSGWAQRCCLPGGFLFLHEFMRESGTRVTGEGRPQMPSPLPPGNGQQV